MCRMVRACNTEGHSRYHQNLAAGQYQAGVSAHNTKEDPWYEVCNLAGFQSAIRGQHPLDEAEVASQIAANVVE